MKTISLGIDTATPYLALAIWVDDSCLVKYSDLVERAHAQMIVPYIDNLLQKTPINIRQLTSIGVGVGPGSYTGLRVGVSTAKGIARALDIPLYACSSLAALAHPLCENRDRVLVGMDARREHFYAACYQQKNGALEQIGAVEKKTKDALEQQYGVPLHQGHAPDASYIAMFACRAQQKRITPKPLELLYL